MSEQQARTARRRGRAITAGVLAGGITLAGGAAAFAVGGHDGTDARGRTPRTTQSAPAAQPAASTRTSRDARQARPAEAKKAATQTSARRGTTPSGTALPADDVDQAAYDAYWGAGYDEWDGELLAKLWHEDYSQAKQDAGKKLVAGETLPIQPGDGAKELAPKKVSEIEAFFRAGYDYDDAVRLSKLWHTKDAYGAKLEAGKKLLAHESLPFKP